MESFILYSSILFTCFIVGYYNNVEKSKKFSESIRIIKSGNGTRGGWVLGKAHLGEYGMRMPRTCGPAC